MFLRSVYFVVNCNIHPVSSNLVKVYSLSQIRFLTNAVKIQENRRFNIKKMDENIKYRSDPIVTKLESPEFKSVLTEELIYLAELFKKNNHEIRIAGGAVRDLLCNKRPTDIDFASTATPTQMKDIFTAEDIRMINTNGEKHGTITPRIFNKQNFEITTLRIDTATNGRHATVEFTKNWMLDANRRDLTINSMFLDLDGHVYDYFYGYEDLKNNKVIFVGNPDERIKEDYLRILRYFRFYGRIAKHPNDYDEETLKSICNNIDGLGNISGERIWTEVGKILQGNFVCDIILTLIKTGAAKYMGLPNNPNIQEFERLKLCLNNTSDRMQPITLICGLLHNSDDAIKLNERLKFSVYERNLSYFIIQNRNSTKDENSLLFYQKMSLETIGKLSDMKEYVEELLKYNGKTEIYEKLHKWNIPKCPVNGKMLLDNGCPPGDKLGLILKQLKSIWISSGFTSSSQELLGNLPELLNTGKNDGDVQSGDSNKLSKKRKK